MPNNSKPEPEELMADSPKLLIVMPALNEEDSVALVVKEVATAIPEADVAVVDDGSTDRTPELAKQAGAILLQLPFHVGIGGAIRTGMRYAHQNGYHAVVTVDADGQHDPRDVRVLLDHLHYGDEPEVVIGSRFAGRGDYRVQGPRKWAMRLLSRSMSRLSRTELTDVTSGFRAYNRAAVQLLERTYPAEYLVEVIDSLVMLSRAGARVNEVPVAMRPRRAGIPSQSAFRSTVYLVRALFALLLSRIRR